MRFTRAAAAVLIPVLLLVGVASAQQTEQPAVVFAYACSFERSENQAVARVALQSETGRPMAQDVTLLQVQQRGQTAPLSRDDVIVEPQAERPPLRLVIVLDITDTVPLVELTAVLSESLLAELLPEDEVALITFGDTVAPVTPFTANKQQFADDYLTGLRVTPGDNRLYDAIAAALDSFPFAPETRRAVLVITDSGRRVLEQTPSAAIIAQARQDKTQIYNIAFVSRDQPDIEELTTISTEAGGYTWYYGEANNTRASIALAVQGYIGQFVRVLDSEVIVRVSALNLIPDSASRATLEISALRDDASPVSDQVACPIEVLQHEIAFITDPGGAPVTGRIDIGVNARSDLGRDRTRIVFRVNDEVVQTSNASVYTFDATQLQPGFYTIEAELWDNANNTLARTPSALRLYVQQPLQFTVDTDMQVTQGGLEGQVSGLTTLIVSGSAGIVLPDVEFRAAPVGEPDRSQILGTAPFVDGKASLQIADLAAELRRLFPEAANGGSYELSARVPSPSAGSPALAGSNPLPLELEPAVIPTPTPARVVPRPPNWRVTLGVPLIVLLVALLLNLLLLRAIRRRRIQRVILYPDTIDLGPQLMTLTVLRDGVRQAHPLTKKTVTIGRGSSNDINISDDANVSRQHGAILWRKGEWWYSNRKSNALTRIDGKARRGFYLHRLDGVTEFQIGDVVMIFHSSAQQDIADFIKTDL